MEDIRATFEAQSHAKGEDADQLIAELLGADPGDDGAAEELWQQVKTNLKAGRVRLVFVADRIPGEVRRIVEFLNEQMDPAEVLAVELPQFVGEDVRIIVPRVIGNTAEAQRNKSTRPATRIWDEAQFFQALKETESDETVQIARRLLKWM